MKYVLVTTQYWGDSKMVEERYVAHELAAVHETRKLSEALVWDTFDEIADYVEDNEIDDCRVVHIKDKDYFMAKLADK